MRAISEPIAFVLLLVFVVFLIAICAPYFLSAGKSSAKYTASTAKPATQGIGTSFTILLVENVSGHPCVLLKNTGINALHKFMFYFIDSKGQLHIFNYTMINVTSACSCSYGALQPSLPPGECGYVILPVNYSLLKGCTLYAQSDYNARAAYLVP